MKLLYIFTIFFVCLNLHAQTFQSINSQNIGAFISANSSQTGSVINAVQIGNNNKAELNLYNDNVGFLQYGNYNELYFTENMSPDQNSLNIIEVGNQNKISVSGSNSISDGMSIKIIGDHKTVIVNNYK